MENIREILKNHELLFLEKLNTKTRWGKNEIKQIFEQTKTEALLRFIENHPTKSR